MNTGFDPVSNGSLAITVNAPLMDFQPQSQTYVGALEPDILASLDLRTLERMALNKNTPVDLLERLAYHPCAEVRAALSDNANIPLATIWLLARDCDAEVRYQIAENHRFPATVIEILTNDENPYVAWRAQKTIARLQAS